MFQGREMASRVDTRGIDRWDGIAPGSSQQSGPFFQPDVTFALFGGGDEAFDLGPGELGVLGEELAIDFGELARAFFQAVHGIAIGKGGFGAAEHEGAEECFISARSDGGGVLEPTGDGVFRDVDGEVRGLFEIGQDGGGGLLAML